MHQHALGRFVEHRPHHLVRPSTTAVSMPLAGSCFSTDSAHRPVHHGIRRRGGTIFGAALPQLSAGPSGHTNSPHPASREGHHSTTGWSSSFSYRFDRVWLSCRFEFVPGPPELSAINPDAVHDHG